jgi:NADPH:quinone reductase-like Zn-dependent oxidoreductase
MKIIAIRDHDNIRTLPDIVYDTLGGATLDASSEVVKRYTGHVLSRLGRGRTPWRRVRDMKVEPVAECGAGWYPAAGCLPASRPDGRGSWPIANRPQDAILPHKSAPMRTAYARVPACFRLDCPGLHFHVAHNLAPLSFRGATYSGVFTLHPLITGENRAHHGKILAQAAALAEAGKLRPLLNERRFSTADIAAAHALVESGALGKVVVEL